MRSFSICFLPLALAALIVACAPADGPSMTSPDDDVASNREELVRRVYRAFESGESAAVDSIFAEDFVEHEELPGLSPGREGVKQFMAMWRTAFPDFNIEVHHVISEGDMVAAHATFRGTHRGEFFGVAPTGRQIAVPTVDIVRFEDDMAVEHWGVTNEAVMLRQLGVIPEDAGPEGAEPAAEASTDTAQ